MNTRYYVEFDNSGIVVKLAHLFTIHLNVSHVVLEDSGDVDLRELVLAEHDQQAGLAAGSISYDHQPDPTKVLLYTGGGGHVLTLPDISI